jgi:hypothetical protein
MHAKRDDSVGARYPDADTVTPSEEVESDTEVLAASAW